MGSWPPGEISLVILGTGTWGEAKSNVRYVESKEGDHEIELDDSRGVSGE